MSDSAFCDPDKAALRQAMRRARADMASRSPDAAFRLVDHCPPELLRHRVVAGYQPIRHEIDPWPLMARLAGAGARLALPVTPPKGSDQPLTFKLWSPGTPLAPGAFGVAEPGAKAEVVTPDLILVPLLAFDRHGARLGYGAGHFDRTLAALRDRAALMAVGLAYAGQAVDRVPTGPHDQTLDAILTEKGYRAVKEDF